MASLSPPLVTTIITPPMHFCMGSSTVPSLGFERQKIIVSFTRTSAIQASTCFQSLTLPTFSDLGTMTEAMNVVIKGNDFKCSMINMSSGFSFTTFSDYDYYTPYINNSIHFGHSRVIVILIDFFSLASNTQIQKV